MNQSDNILELLRQLQIGPDQGGNIPGQDPRAQAIDQYMQMRGGGQVPPVIQQMPRQGRATGKTLTGTRPMNRFEGEDISQSGYEQGKNNYENTRDANTYEDPNAYFDRGKDYEGDVDTELTKEGIRQDMRRPSYVGSKGQPSPNKDYNDEDLLAKLAARLNGENR